MDFLQKTIMSLAVSSMLISNVSADIPRVYLPEQATAVEKYAAKELSATLTKMLDKEIRVVVSDTPPRSGGIVLGSLESSDFVRKNAEKFKLTDRDAKDDIPALHTMNSNLYLVGNTPRACLFAVYLYLQKELGVKWLWPGEKGEFIPKRGNWKCPDIAMTYKPPFRIRSINPIRARTEETEIWMARNFLNCGATLPASRDQAGFDRMLGGHFISLAKGDYEKHPDLFALVGGKRIQDGIAGCWSNPEFTKLILPRLIGRIKKRNANLVNLFPADNVYRCECKGCSQNPDISSRWYNYYAELQKELKKTFPDLRFCGIAYQEYRNIPKDEVRGMEAIQYCHYNRCYSHGLEDPDCPVNLQSVKEMAAWSRKVPVGIYGYEFCMMSGYEKLYLPFWSMLNDEFKLYQKMKFPWVHAEMMLGIDKDKKQRSKSPREVDRLANYIYVQLAWNPSLTVDEILNDFCRTVYGPAAIPMFNYHREMGEAWNGLKQHISFGSATGRWLASHMMTEAKIKTMQTYLEHAEKMIKDAPSAENRERYLDDLTVDKELFSTWADMFKLLNKGEIIALGTNADLEKIPNLPLKSKNGRHQKTVFKAYYTQSALHLKAICYDGNMKELVRGTNKRDAWEFRNSIELFIDANPNSMYKHFSVTPSGGKFDAEGRNAAWNAEWNASTEFFDDRWEVNIEIPFRAIGVKKISKDTLWNLLIIRNGNDNYESCGYPHSRWHDIGNAGKVYLSEKNTAGRSLFWIFPAPEDLNQNKTRGIVQETITNYIPALIKEGWSFDSVTGPEATEKIRSSVILVNTFKNKIPQSYFERNILPAVKDGALLIFNSYGALPLEQYLSDKDFKVRFTEKLKSNETSFDDAFGKCLGTISAHSLCAYIPANPSKWSVLATVESKNGKNIPSILCTKYGKGMIILSSNIAYRNNTARTIGYINAFLQYKQLEDSKHE